MLHRLRLTHFRNYERLHLELSPGVNAFIGANGQGKTNLLEAVHFLSLLRSFRTTKNTLLPLGGTGDFSLYGEADAFPEGLVRLADCLPHLFTLDSAAFYDGTDAERRLKYRLAWSVAVFLEKGAPDVRFAPFKDVTRDYVQALLATHDPHAATAAAFRSEENAKLFRTEWLRWWTAHARP